MTKKITLITGAAGDAQGWGNMHVTEEVCRSIVKIGYDCDILYVNSPEELEKGLTLKKPDIVWSALYFFSDSADIIGSASNVTWVADLLEKWNVPYVGPTADAMKKLISKFETHKALSQAGVSVPKHTLCPPSRPEDVDYFPAFVKPNGESRSIGISDKSVVETPEQLRAQVDFIHDNLKQEALVEEFLPGREYTVMVLGNGKHQEVLPGRVTVSEEHYGKYNILRSDLRGVGLTKVSIPTEHQEECIQLAKDACRALGCKDHIRIDMKEGADGKIRIMEVNGIPGLKPVKSWSPQIYALYHPEGDVYSNLIHAILKASLSDD